MAKTSFTARVSNQLLMGAGSNSWQDRGASQIGAVMTLNPYYQNNYYFRWQEYARWYYTSWEAKKIIQIPVDDAFRIPFEISGIDEEYANQLKKAMQKLDYLNKCKRAAIQERMLGGCVGVMGVKARTLEDGTIEEDDPSKPLNPALVDKDDLQFFNIVSINLITKADWETNPLSPNYDRPTHYYINGIKTHVSRLIVWDGNPIFSYQSQRLIQQHRINVQGFGESVLVPIYDALIRCIGTQQAGYQLVNMASVLLVKVEKLLDLEATKPGERAVNYLKNIIEQASIYRGAIVEGKGVDVTNQAASFGSVPELLMSYLQIISAASDIPATRFLGEAPGGLNSDGKSSLENYYNHIQSYQTEGLLPKHQKFFDVFAPSVLGRDVWDKIKDKFEIKFAPLWNLSEEQQAIVDRTRAEVAVLLEEAGFISREQGADELNQREILKIKIDKDALPDMSFDQYQAPDTNGMLDKLGSLDSGGLKGAKLQRPDKLKAQKDI